MSKFYDGKQNSMLVGGPDTPPRFVCPMCEGQGVITLSRTQLNDYLFAVLRIEEAYRKFYCDKDESARFTIRQAIEILKSGEVPCGECAPPERKI
jgi:hypothetical protein